MAGPVVEEQVVLEANGQALFAVMAKVDNDIRKIRNSINAMGDDVLKDAKKFEQAMATIGGKLEMAKMKLATLSQLNNTPSGRIQDLNANRGLARQTLQATQYARELNVARNSVEALDAKIAKLNQNIAKAGANGGFATIAQTDQLKKLEQASKMLRQLDTDFERMQIKARRVRDVDLTAELRAVMDARNKLFSAASNGRRTNLGPELLAVSDAQVALQERITAARAAETQALRASLRARRELAVADAAGIKDINQLETARLTNARRLAELRAELRAANAAERVQLLQNIDIEKARGAQIRANIADANRLARAESGGGGGAGAPPGRTGLNKYLPSGGIAAVATRTLAYGGIASAAFGVVNEAKQGLEFTIQLEDELQRLQAIAGATDYQLVQMRASIIEVGNASRYSLLDLTKISQTLAQAGVTAGDMREVLQSVTALATASGSTPDEAVNLVTGALGAFQLQASETARVADLMTTALNRTKLTVQQTGQAIQYVGATAFEQNLSLEDLLATVGAMAQAGIKSGSTIGTGLRQFLVDLQTPSKKLTEALKSVGLTAADVNVSVYGQSEVLQRLRDAGFGAAQAYGGLETRAAAAYLVLKNNVPVMDQLKLAFAQTGAAAEATDKAMDSWSAQWTRFKNVVGAGFAGYFDDTLEVAKNLLRDITDAIVDARGLLGAIPAPMPLGQSLDQRGVLGTLFTADLGTPLIDSFKTLQRVALDGMGAVSAYNAMFGTSIEGWGTQYEKWANRVGESKRAQRDLETQVSESTERVQAQAGVIGQLDKEMGRLLTQHAGLRGETIRTSAETVTLMSKFEGLSKYIVGATGDYDALIGAMARYRTEAANTLAIEAAGQVALQGQAVTNALGRGRTAQVRILQNQALLNQLTPQERNAVRGDNPKDPANANLIANAGNRLNNADLRQLAQEVGKAAGAETSRTIAQSTGDAARARAYWPNIDMNVTRAQAGLAELAGLQGTARTNKANEAKTTAQAVVRFIDNLFKNSPPNDPSRPQLNQWRSDANAVIQGVTAALKPTKDEEKAANAVEKQPKITQADIDAFARVAGLPLGSGVRTVAEQNALHAARKTRATGATSAHSTGAPARDFPTGQISDEQGRRLEQVAQKYFADQGITGLHIKYENGRGRNNGTGPHLHINARRNQRRSGPPSDGKDGFATDAALNQSQTQIDQRTYNTALKNIKGASSQALFSATVDAAREALTALNDDLTRDGLNDLARQGIALESDPRYQARMAQVADAIAQNKEQFDQAVADGLIKSTERQMKAAQTAFELSMKPFEDRVAAAQGAVTGLGLWSNRFTPDYVSTLAQNRVAQAQEAQVRARAASLPELISQNQSTLTGLQGQLGAGIGADGKPLEGNALETVRQRVQELTKAIADLRTEKSNLDAQLSAGGLVPATVGDGLRQAIEAYQQARPVFDDFRSGVIASMGEAVELLGTEFSDLFTNILNGSMTAVQAFNSFVTDIMKGIQQIVTKMIVTKIIDLLFSVVGGWVGGAKAPAAGGMTTGMSTTGANAFVSPTLRFNGGPIGYNGGGRVANGTAARDSVNAKLAQGEWVIRKKAVDSLGDNFMARLNAHGAGALSAMQAVPVLPPPAKQDVKVYVTQPNRPPSLSKNDVLVTVAEDMLSGGETAKLIKHISNGG